MALPCVLLRPLLPLKSMVSEQSTAHGEQRLKPFVSMRVRIHQGERWRR